MYTLKDGISQSMMLTFLACKKKMLYELQGWELGVSFKSYFDFGNLFHLLLEKHYGPHSQDFRTVLKEWRAHVNPLLKVEELELIEGTIEVLFPRYLEMWGKRDAGYRWVGLEKLFDVEWNGFRLRGKIDGIFEVGKGKCTRKTLENKCKSQISDDEISSTLAFDFQSLFYATALEAMNCPTSGCLYNVIRMPGIKPKQKETLPQYFERLASEVDKDPNHYFKRYEATYPKVVQDEFKKELYEKLCDFRDWLEGDVPTYKNESSCIGRGRCPFLSACAAGDMTGYAPTRKLFRELIPVKLIKVVKPMKGS